MNVQREMTMASRPAPVADRLIRLLTEYDYAPVELVVGEDVVWARFGSANTSVTVATPKRPEDTDEAVAADLIILAAVQGFKPIGVR